MSDGSEEKTKSTSDAPNKVVIWVLVIFFIFPISFLVGRLLVIAPAAVVIDYFFPVRTDASDTVANICGLLGGITGIVSGILLSRIVLKYGKELS